MIMKGKLNNQLVTTAIEKIKDKSFEETELDYQIKLSECEAQFGELSGEAGLILISLKQFYMLHGESQKALLIEQRIRSIVEDYELDG